MAKTADEIHQEELAEISKEVLASQDKEGIHYSFDPEALLAIKKRREAREKAIAEAKSKKVSKK